MRSGRVTRGALRLADREVGREVAMSFVYHNHSAVGGKHQGPAEDMNKRGALLQQQEVPTD